MENKITIGEDVLDRADARCKEFDNTFDGTLLNPLNDDHLAYAKAFNACVENIVGYFGGNRKLAESYVKIARQLRIEDPEGFKARVKAFNSYKAFNSD